MGEQSVPLSCLRSESSLKVQHPLGWCNLQNNLDSLVSQAQLAISSVLIGCPGWLIVAIVYTDVFRLCKKVDGFFS